MGDLTIRFARRLPVIQYKAVALRCACCVIIYVIASLASPCRTDRNGIVSARVDPSSSSCCNAIDDSSREWNNFFLLDDIKRLPFPSLWNKGKCMYSSSVYCIYTHIYIYTICMHREKEMFWLCLSIVHIKSRWNTGISIFMPFGCFEYRRTQDQISVQRRCLTIVIILFASSSFSQPGHSTTWRNNAWPNTPPYSSIRVGGDGVGGGGISSGPNNKLLPAYIYFQGRSNALDRRRSCLLEKGKTKDGLYTVVISASLTTMHFAMQEGWLIGLFQ